MIYMARHKNKRTPCDHYCSQRYDPQPGDVAWCDLQSGHWIRTKLNTSENWGPDYYWKQAGWLRSWWYGRKFPGPLAPIGK